jgi:phosphate transport system substrate-binding protein
VSLLGFSDSAGDVNSNAGLSRDRAKMVADLLSARGMDIGTVDGFGGVRPLAGNDTAEGRQRNRRVEVWVSGMES